MFCIYWHSYFNLCTIFAVVCKQMFVLEWYKNKFLLIAIELFIRVIL